MATKTARHFCPSCGFPLRGGSACEACGSEREAIDLRDGERRSWPRADAPVPPGLERATESWQARDYPRAVQLSLAELGATPFTGTDGPGWILELEHRVLVVLLLVSESKLLVETPVAYLPEKLRVGALRAALEACDEARLGARFVLRTDRVIARFVARLGSLSPEVIREAVYDVTLAARALEGRLVDTLGGRVVPQNPEEAGVAWAALGKAKRIGAKVAPKDRSLPPAALRREEEDAPKPRPSRSRPAPPPSDPPTLAPPRVPTLPKPLPIPAIPALTAPTPPAARVFAPQAPPSEDDGLPPILSPAFAFGSAPPPRIPSPIPAPRTPDPASDRRRQAATLPDPSAAPDFTAPLQGAPALEPTRGPAYDAVQAPIRAPSRQQMSMPGTMAGVGSAPKASMPEIELDPITRVRGASGEFSLSPGDRLCELLQKAQSLAILVGPRADCARWLVRSTAFRAYYEFYDTVPDAVAQLYRATARDPHSPEGPLAVMESLIAQRANVPKEKPLAIDPMTTATQAKDHAARYLTEIEAAPNDPALRHFMALGALAELMVRTKLPQPTEQRLREIVSHARREGAKASSVELLMTALARIGS